MDSAAPTVFDRALVRRRLERALRGGFGGFLLERAADDLAGRLAAVTRPFRVAADIGTPTPAAAGVLARSGRARPSRSRTRKGCRSRRRASTSPCRSWRSSR